MGYSYSTEKFNALEAISWAQQIVHSPMLFQALICLRDNGVLHYLDSKNEEGASLEEITHALHLSEYECSTLLDMALSGYIVKCVDGKFSLTKTGNFLIHDTMTKINLDFVNEVCYQGLYYLKESFATQRPQGLKVFGPWESIYPHLKDLPPKAREAWFRYDHFYSDYSYQQILPYLLTHKQMRLYDIGANTGAFSLACTASDPSVSCTLIDLPEQIQLAKDNIEAQASADQKARLAFHTCNMLDDEDLELPSADLYFMSQFLDCFSEEQIRHLLGKIKRNMRKGSKIAILELFNDNQKFEASAFAINAGSLYFTAMANGNSRFYSKSKMLQLLSEVHLTVESAVENLGLCHTLLICRNED